MRTCGDNDVRITKQDASQSVVFVYASDDITIDGVNMTDSYGNDGVDYYSMRLHNGTAWWW